MQTAEAIPAQAVRSRSIGQYIDTLKSKSPTPSGGGASALSVSCGIALALMVVNLTLGKEKYRAHEERVAELGEALELLLKEASAAADQDEAAFLKLSAAYKLPRGTEEEKAERAKGMEHCLSGAAEVPLRLMQCGKRAAALLPELLDYGNRMAVSDVGIAAELIGAGVKSAYFNVLINAGSLRDAEAKRKLVSGAEALRRETEAETAELSRRTEAILRL